MTTTQTKLTSKKSWESKWRFTNTFKTSGSRGANKMILISITTILARESSRRLLRTIFATHLSRSRMITLPRPANSYHQSICSLQQRRLNQKVLRICSQHLQNSRNCSLQSTTRASRVFWKISTSKTLHPRRTLSVHQPLKSRSKSKTARINHQAALSQWNLIGKCRSSRTTHKMPTISRSSATIAFRTRRLAWRRRWQRMFKFNTVALKWCQGWWTVATIRAS